jgi:hypothetical protein
MYHQRDKFIIAQMVLLFQYEVEKKSGGMTALSGLPLYLEFAHLMGLWRVFLGPASFFGLWYDSSVRLQRRSLQTTATLDMDATLVETFKRAALYWYKKFKAYQPLNVYWAEQGIVPDRDIPGDELIWRYRGRCGKSEEAHWITKEDLAGGKLPSGLFGANAAWRQIMILAFNVNSAMKRLVLGESWVNRRMKAIRLWSINLPGRVLEHGRQLFVRLAGGHSSNEILFEPRRRMACLCNSG